MRLGREFSVDVLPPYIEFVRGDRVAPCPADDLREAAAETLAVQVERLPVDNPVRRFGERLEVDLPRLLDDQGAYHLYAFATVRQCGAAWEAAATYFDWLADGEDGTHARAAVTYTALAGSAKTLLFKLARASAKGRLLDPAPDIDEMAGLWDEAAEAAPHRKLTRWTPVGLTDWVMVGVAPGSADQRLEGLDGELAAVPGAGHGGCSARGRRAVARTLWTRPRRRGLVVPVPLRFAVGGR